MTTQLDYAPVLERSDADGRAISGDRSRFDISSLTIDIQARGVRMDAPMERRAGGAGPTDLGMLWIEGYRVTAPTTNVGDTPYSLRAEDEGYGIYVDGVRLAGAQAQKRPRYYDLKTADGIPYEQIALLHLDSLATTVIQTCTYWGNADQCTFCGIGVSLDAGRTIVKKTPAQKLAKLIAPWPTPDILKSRQADALQRPLFRNSVPLSFTLEADFKAVNKDRDPASTRRFPAALQLEGDGGATKSLSVSVSGRGHLRRQSSICSFIPLRLELPKADAAGTDLEGPAAALKLVTHCQSSKEHDQFVLREYAAYRIANLLSPWFFRARLATVTYSDSTTKKAIATRYGILLEDDDDVARRMEGRTVSVERTLFKDLEQETLARMMVFQYMIGNTDFSIFALHNVVIVQTPDRTLYPATYDFDLSGLVNAPYAAPAPNLGLKTVLERYYRGPCLTEPQFASVFESFKSKKEAIFAVLGTIPDLTAESREQMRKFLAEFFDLIDRPLAVKRAFIDGCKRTTM